MLKVRRARKALHQLVLKALQVQQALKVFRDIKVVKEFKALKVLRP